MQRQFSPKDTVTTAFTRNASEQILSAGKTGNCILSFREDNGHARYFRAVHRIHPDIPADIRNFSTVTSIGPIHPEIRCCADLLQLGFLRFGLLRLGNCCLLRFCRNRRRCLRRNRLRRLRRRRLSCLRHSRLCSLGRDLTHRFLYNCLLRHFFSCGNDYR